MRDPVLRDYAGSFVDELHRSGLRDVCIAPGSRSAPLAFMFEQHPGVHVWMHLDERSCAFFALGIARASRRPVAVLTTSGTAAAEMYPAVIEARYGRVPLVVLTADRPPELREVGAPQTIDQIGLYNEHVKWFADMALPEASHIALRYVRTTADRAMALAAEAPAGPVHLNFPFREPLIPEMRDRSFSPSSPLVRVESGRAFFPPGRVRSLAAELREYDRGLIVCGPHNGELTPAVADLAASLGFPLLADPLSQVRCGSAAGAVIASYDAFLRDSATAGRLAPDVVIRLGALPTSKPLAQFLQRHGSARHIVIDVDGWNDPLAIATDILHVDPETLCADLAASVSPRQASAWEETWRELDRVTRDTIESYLSEIDEPFEGKVFAQLAPLLPSGTLLYVGSSMPVRDLDTFFPPMPRSIRFLANRGANGIDGVISSALGAATVTRPLVLVLGDLSFYHDMNGLLAAHLHDLNATVVLLNNDGGGIFSFLPQREEEGFETLFGTPHGLDFAPAVSMYGGRFTRADRWPNFQEAVEGAIHGRGLSVIEVPTERERNVQLHRALWARVAEAVATHGVAPV